MSDLFTIPKHRLDPLIDGIFAVALTVLVLEIKVPELRVPGSSSELVAALAQYVPVIIAYFISFALLGLFWIWHHKLAEKVSRVDGALLCCTLALLALVCFFPFAAAVFGRYMIHGNVGSLIVYLPVLGLILLAQTLYLVVAKKRGLIRDDVPRSELLAAHKRNVFFLGAFLLSCVPASFLLGMWAAVACAGAGIALIVVGVRAS